MKGLERKTVMVFGIGKLGGPVADILAALHESHRFVLVSRSRERSEKRANLCRYLAAQWARYPEIVGEEADLRNTDSTSQLIARYRPFLVFNATTPFPWWKIESLPEVARRQANQAGPGMWCALDCLLPMLLTKSLAQSGVDAIHVNACYPDMTNAFLAGQVCAPQLGIGNISNLVPGLQIAFADLLGVRVADIGVQIVGHHYVSWNAPSAKGCSDAPYELTVTHPTGSLRFSGPDDSPFRELRARASRVRGLDGLGVTIGSASTLLDQLLGGRKRRHHSPGACGLPGGYPVVLGDGGIPQLDLPSHLNPELAARVNCKAQRFDGIEHVAGGEVVATELARQAHRDIVGFELPPVRTHDVEGIAAESIARLDSRYGLGLGGA